MFLLTSSYCTVVYKEKVYSGYKISKPTMKIVLQLSYIDCITFDNPDVFLPRTFQCTPRKIVGIDKSTNTLETELNEKKKII